MEKYMVLLLVVFVVLAGCSSQRFSDLPDVSSEIQSPSSVSSSIEENSCSEQKNLTVTQQKVVDHLPDNQEKYGLFLEYGSPSFVIPGLKEKFIPQGMCLLPSENKIVISYYSGEKGQDSILCLVDPATGEMEKWVRIKDAQGKAYTGHGGGIAASEKNLWLTTSETLMRIPVADLMAAANGEQIRFVDEFVTGTKNAFASCQQGILWGGEFYDTFIGGNYKTDESHRMTTPDGTNTRAWVVGFDLDQQTQTELPESKVAAEGQPMIPDYILSIPAKIQGMTRLEDGTIVLSESAGRSNQSHLIFHRNVLKEEHHDTVLIGDVEVPLWYLDSNTLVGKLVTPPMSEGIVFYQNSIWQLYESAADKYFGASTDPIDYVYQIKDEVVTQIAIK